MNKKLNEDIPSWGVDLIMQVQEYKSEVSRKRARKDKRKAEKRQERQERQELVKPPPVVKKPPAMLG